MTLAYPFEFGAVLLAPDLTRFQLWAPQAQQVLLEFEDGASIPMTRIDDGWFRATVDCGAGTRYAYRVSEQLLIADPASRRQAADVHGWSVVVDPDAYEWQTSPWVGRAWHEAIIYELHVGALGGFVGVIDHLEHLVQLGVTAIELMPVADFPGAFNWGYDGVLPFAPATAYGSPDDLKRLVDAAHGAGLMVLLDVVYNHFGPDGNYLATYAPEFYRHDHSTPWGDGIDFRRPQVARFFIENAIFWLTEYRIDGLRFDAVHAIDDKVFLQELAARTRAAVEPLQRHVHLVLENEHRDIDLLCSSPGAPGYDAQWADDFHHAIHVMLTGENEGYYQPFEDRPAELLALCLQNGFAFPGTKPGVQDLRSADLPVTCFVTCLQNHDQIGNRALGERLAHLAEPAALRAATALLLLIPQIPLLFMGEEWGATSPFLYFANHTGELAEAIRSGRQREFSHFSAFENPAQQQKLPDPTDRLTFAASMPDAAEAQRDAHALWLKFYTRLLAIRRAEIIPRLLGSSSLGAEVLGDFSVRARWQMGDESVLTVAVNLGGDAVPCPPSTDRVVFTTEAREAGNELAPYSVVVWLSVFPDDR